MDNLKSLSIVFLLFIASLAFAQQKKFTPEEEALKKHILTFGETYGTFGKHKDRVKVLDYMDKEVLGTLITIFRDLTITSKAFCSKTA
jgi:hypothetical protein